MGCDDLPHYNDQYVIVSSKVDGWFSLGMCAGLYVDIRMDMHIDVRIDMWKGMCVDMHAVVCMCMYVYTRAIAATGCDRVGVAEADATWSTRRGSLAGMCTDMCVDMRVDVWVGSMHVDMRVEMCVDRHVCSAVDRHVCRHGSRPAPSRATGSA